MTRKRKTQNTKSLVSWLPTNWQPRSFWPKTEIAPRVWVGDESAAAALRNADGWTLICVRETDCKASSNVKHISLLRMDARGQASKESLNEIADAIDAARERGNVLVHCWAGIERSPLSLVWWLCKREGYTVEGAYKHIQGLRPQVRDCLDWLSNGARKALGLKPRPPMGFPKLWDDWAA